MRVMTLFILILAIMGILINFIPEMFFYFKVVTHMKYYGKFSDGLWLFYAGIYFTIDNNYGFIINITKLNASYYLVQSKLYLLPVNSSFNPDLLPSLPFKASSIKEVDNYTAILDISNSTFLQILFPQSDLVKTSLLNFSISNSTATVGPNNFFGCPGGFRPAETGNPHIPVDYYILYGLQYLLVGFLATHTNLSTKLFILMFPNYSLSESLKTHLGNLFMVLGYGNGIPAQDWLKWITYGFSRVLPINIILLVSAGVLAIYDYRRTH